jgi:hypothetical protein
MFQLFDGPLRDECSKVLFSIGTQLTNRLLHTSRKVSRLAFMDVTSRVAKTLIDLTEEPDAMSHPKGMQIRISRQEISRIVGCSREMVGRGGEFESGNQLGDANPHMTPEATAAPTATPAFFGEGVPAEIGKIDKELKKLWQEQQTVATRASRMNRRREMA